MSSILLSNPFASPPQLPNSGSVQTPNVQIIAAPQQSSAGGGAGDSTSFGGSGGGQGSGGQSPLAFLAKALERGSQRPSQPTGASIVNAQTMENGTGETKDAADGPVKVGPDLPAVEMPDPLPTSPFLLRLSKET